MYFSESNVDNLTQSLRK